jgi:hypothetical protein
LPPEFSESLPQYEAPCSRSQVETRLMHHLEAKCSTTRTDLVEPLQRVSLSIRSPHQITFEEQENDGKQT